MIEDISSDGANGVNSASWLSISRVCDHQT